MAEYNVGGFAGALTRGAQPLQAGLMQMLTDRRAARQLNPMREALLASQAQSNTLGQPSAVDPMSMTADGAQIPGMEGAAPQQATPRAPLTPQQQMIMAAAQDPKAFGQLAQNYGPLEVGALMQQAPRVREIVVHPEDELNKRLGLGLNGAESVIVKLEYDEQDRQLPGFTIEQYKTSADNTETASNRQSYPAGPLGQALYIDDLRELEGLPRRSSIETENYFNEARMTSGKQQDYRRWHDQQIASGIPEDELPDYTDWSMTAGAGNAYAGVFGENEGKRIAEYTIKAQAALPSLTSIERAYELIDQGLIAGAGAEARLGLVRAIDTVLGRETDAKSAATDAYLAASGQRVAEQITAFGAGTGLSDADRDFARLITAGKIDMTPQALRMALEILARGKLGEIQKYNQTKEGLQGNFALLRPYMPEIVAPESIYGRISPLNVAPAGMDDSQKLNFYLSQRPSYLAPTQGTAQSLPPAAGQGPTPQAAPPGPDASPDEIAAFYNRR